MTDDPNTARRRAPWTLLAPLPAIAYFIVFARDVIQSGYLIFGRLDLVVLTLAILFLVAAILSARSALARALCIMGWSTLIAVGVAEILVRQVVPQPALENFPLPPMRRVSDVADRLPGIRGPVRFTVNTWGVRGPEPDVSREAVRILCVGGSATECLYVTDERTWPMRLADRLRARGGNVGTCEVHNAGRSGHMALHHAHLVEHYQGMGRFDLVVAMVGVNDLGAALHEDRAQREARVAGEALFYRVRPHEPSHRRLALWRWLESAFDVGIPLANGQILQDPQGHWIAGKRASRQRMLRERPRNAPPPSWQQDLSAYRSAIARLIRAARDRGVPLVLVTQPTLWRDGLSPELEALLWEQTNDAAYTATALADMMAAYNDALLDVADREGVPTIRLAGRLPADETVFYDDCHFNDSGCEKVADLLTQPVWDIVKGLWNDKLDRP